MQSGGPATGQSAGNSAAVTSPGAAGAAAQQPKADAAIGDASMAHATTPVDASVPPDAGAGQAQPSVLTSTQTLIPDPSWDCKMGKGIAPPASAELVLTAELKVGPVMDLGQTQYGQRTIVPITGGTITGTKITGQVMDGGLDWQLTRANGVVEIEEVAILQTNDGATIYLRNCGVSPGAGSEVRIAPDFEAGSSGAYAWLNTGTFIGTRELDLDKKTLKLSVYDATKVSTNGVPPSAVSVPKLSSALPSQAWDCEQPKGPPGATVYTEAVSIGGGIIAIGASKYGTRNIIPITGGTFSGQKLNGDVISGGADFQLTANGSSDLQLDARYTLRTNDGELIAVRNCGSATGSKLYFETRSAGPYAWLNTGAFTSTVGLAIGGVAITIYEAQ
jgi:hypothetical protein